MNVRRATLAALLMMSCAALAGCADDGPDGDDGPGTGTSEPRTNDWSIEDLPASITGLEPLTQIGNGSATGVWVEDDIAYLSGGQGLRIYDVAVPEEPILLAEGVEGTTGSRDVDLLVHPDGRSFAVMAHGGSRISLTDVTDPTAPFLVAEVTDIGPAHNIAVVPNSTVVYNSRSISQHVPTPGTTGQIDIVDFADPAAPSVTVFAFPAVATSAAGVPKPVLATTCHDITFTPGLERAYCAGVTETHVWDVSDPLQPVILQVILNPLNNIHHGAWAARNGTLLIIGDEFAGAVAGPVCLDPIPNPYAALWFWDISDLATPVPLGYYQISYNGLAEGNTALCTTHFGTLIEDRDAFVLGWYTAGIAVVDFSDPSSPSEVARFRGEGTNVWDAFYHKGHVFTGDTGRGMDILRLV